MYQFPSPKVLQCSRFVAPGCPRDSRSVRDYEFDCYLGGEREVEIDGRLYRVARGSLVFRKPGQQTRGSGSYNMYMLTLSFSNCPSLSPEKYLRSSTTPQQTLLENSVLDVIPDVFFPYHFEELCALYKAICNCSYPNVVNEALQEQLVTEFLFLVLADAHQYRREHESNIPSKKQYVEQACNYINRHYAEPISVDMLAKNLSLNKNYFIKIFRQETGTTPNQYIIESRLFYAKLLLVQTELPIQQIASDCGFNTASYFAKTFREKYSLSPMGYRKQYKEEESKKPSE